MATLRRAFVGLVAVLLLAACVAQPGTTISPGSSPTERSSATGSAAPETSPALAGDDCSTMTASPDYCRRLANWMRDQRGLAAQTPLRVEELPPPTCGTASDGEKILCTYSGAGPRTLRATLASGESFAADLPCAGIPSSAICFEHPPLQAVGMGGYWDVPCSGEAPSGCATPVIPDSDAVQKAHALVIDELRLPVGAVGHHEVEIGTAVLPNGILSHTSITLAKADEIQHGFIIDPMWVALRVVPTDPNRPQFVSVYERGRFPGLETVKVLLVWDVVETSPDAVVHLQNIEVR